LTDIAEKYFKDLSLSKINYLLNPIDALYMNITKERGVSCWEGNCMSNSITINPDGTVANCPDVAVNNGELFGNILKDDVSKIFSSKNRIKLIALQKSFLCDCEHITVCNGGCPLHFQGGDQKSCRGFFTMLRHFRNVYNLTSFFGQPPATKPYGL
jgi:radical SAM protein with 4Fe4S-binding SPASM domain